MDQDKQHKIKMKKCYDALTRVVVELKGMTLTDDDTIDLSNRLHDLMIILHSQQSNKFKEKTKAFNDAMNMLQKIRK